MIILLALLLKLPAKYPFASNPKLGKLPDKLATMSIAKSPGSGSDPPVPNPKPPFITSPRANNFS